MYFFGGLFVAVTIFIIFGSFLIERVDSLVLLSFGGEYLKIETRFWKGEMRCGLNRFDCGWVGDGVRVELLSEQFGELIDFFFGDVFLLFCFFDYLLYIFISPFDLPFYPFVCFNDIFSVIHWSFDYIFRLGTMQGGPYFGQMLNTSIKMGKSFLQLFLLTKSCLF